MPLLYAAILLFENQTVIKLQKNILENVLQYQIKVYICITKSKHHDK